MLFSLEFLPCGKNVVNMEPPPSVAEFYAPHRDVRWLQRTMF